ncbi:LacI family DNA-binding transcriptional regulator [Streptosporangium sp. NPDC000396]|uniref:LacI family DNA-binding transcriptional regulator n=1 Tax=Streptosporangium sp. NPDC000396 TaxID=3366185 RepID=UPI0036C9DCF8
MTTAGEVPPQGRGRGRKAPSMADVARLAGVSAQTVSRVVNNRSNVEETTRDRVLSAMRALGYQPNGAARALATGRFGTIGVICFTLNSHGNVRTLDGIATAALEAGFSINLMGVTGPTNREVREAFTRLNTQAVDGVIIIEAQVLDSPSLRLPQGVPVVMADGHGGQEYPVVDSDQVTGARLATEHLLERGHATVWHVAGPPDAYSARRRHAAWLETLERAGRPVPQVLFGDWTAESGYRLGRHLARDPEATAVFAANDQMAMGVLRAMHESGRAVPGDVAVVGFDDTPEAAYMWPALTTVRQNFAQVGRACVEVLLDQVRTGTLARGDVQLVPVELVVRSSSDAKAAGLQEAARRS